MPCCGITPVAGIGRRTGGALPTPADEGAGAIGWGWAAAVVAADMTPEVVGYCDEYGLFMTG